LNVSTKFIVSTFFLFFVAASKDLFMAKASNHLVVLVQNEELEEAPFNVNVFQWSH
jgi:hypothetical protein